MNQILPAPLNLGNPQKTFGHNRANAQIILITMLVFIAVGIFIIVMGMGRKRPNDVIGFVGGGAGMLVISAGLFWAWRAQLRAKCEVYKRGFALTNWLGRSTICRWNDITQVYEFVGYYRNTFRPNHWVYTVWTKDGQKFKLDMALSNVSGLGALVFDAVTDRLLAQGLDTYRSGGTISFGDEVGIHSRGFVSGQQELAWADVEKIQFGKTKDLIIYQIGKRTPWKWIIHSKIANYPVLVMMILHVAKPPVTQAVIEGISVSSPSPIPGAAPASIGEISGRLGRDVRELLMVGYSMEQIHEVLDGKIGLEELEQSKPAGKPQWLRENAVCQLIRPPESMPTVPTKSEIFGLVLCALTFVIAFSQSSVRTTNGRVVASSYTDSGAIIGGIVILIIAVITLMNLGNKTLPSDRIKRGVILLLLLVFGVVHLLRGFGIILSPVPPVGSKGEITTPVSTALVLATPNVTNLPTRMLTSVSSVPTLVAVTKASETRSPPTNTPSIIIRKTPTVTNTPGAGIIQEIVMTHNVYPDSRMPASPSLMFGPDEKYIHAVAHTVNVDRERNVQAVWRYAGVPGHMWNSILAQMQAVAKPGDSPYLDFWISPTSPLTEGTYIVEILVDDVFAGKAEFAISRYTAAVATPVPMRLIPTPPFRTYFKFAPDAVLAKDVAPNTYEPIEITETFPLNHKTIHAVLRLDQAPQFTSLKVVWSSLPSRTNAMFTSFAESTTLLSKEYHGIH